jgi:hypothetical protein
MPLLANLHRLHNRPPSNSATILAIYIGIAVFSTLPVRRAGEIRDGRTIKAWEETYDIVKNAIICAVLVLALLGMVGWVGKYDCSIAVLLDIIILDDD